MKSEIPHWFLLTTTFVLIVSIFLLNPSNTVYSPVMDLRSDPYITSYLLLPSPFPELHLNNNLITLPLIRMSVLKS